MTILDDAVKSTPANDVESGCNAPCEIVDFVTGRRLCNNTAEWHMAVKCCGNVKFVCNHCLHRKDRSFTCLMCTKRYEHIVAATMSAYRL